jgi:demethylmenaquinone methyltransferase / 2-methoxy-6-polyprenyl-1,4-benzoquinol methylase
MARAQLDKQPAAIASMFDTVAGRYDLLNDLLSLGQDRWWRRRVARLLQASPGERVLDVAAGTGTSTRAVSRAGAYCVACDFSLGMLRAGLRRRPRGRGAAAGSAPLRTSPPATTRTSPAVTAGTSPAATVGGISFVAGDALRLPFADETFDAVTISFGLRNVADAGAALAEMRRVTRPGGRLVICEFSHPPWPPLNRLYERYLIEFLPAVARRLSRAGQAYRYLAESIQEWPGQQELARQIAAAGWSAVRWHNLSLGVVSVHLACRPSR